MKNWNLFNIITSLKTFIISDFFQTAQWPICTCDCSAHGGVTQLIMFQCFICGHPTSTRYYLRRWRRRHRWAGCSKSTTGRRGGPSSHRPPHQQLHHLRRNLWGRHVFRRSFDSYGKFDILLVTRCGTAPYYICTWCWRRGRLQVGGIHVSLPPERPQAAIRVNQHERRHRQHDGDRLHRNRRFSLLGWTKVCFAGCVKSLHVPKGRRIEGLGQDKPLTPPRLWLLSHRLHGNH